MCDLSLTTSHKNINNNRKRKVGLVMITSIALIIAAIVAIPWLFSRRFVYAAIAAGVSFIIGFIVVYLTTPPIAGPLWGEAGFIALVFSVVSGYISLMSSIVKDGLRKAVPMWTAVVLVILYGILALDYSPLVRGRDYAALVPKIEQRQWSADFQPKDPRHFRVSSPENAIYLAGRAIGQATTLDANGQPNSIGSQFNVSNGRSSVQIIKGELWTIVPIDWSGAWVQFGNTTRVPGYIKVSGENPVIPAEYVSLRVGEQFKYSPESVWGNNLERLVWYSHPDKYIADIHLEVDESGKAFYIVSLSEPTIGWWGEKVTGALIIDPATGEGVSKFIPLGEIPSWVDRVEAERIVHRNIHYHSQYAQGFLNTSIGKYNVLSATATHFGYGSDGQPVFATGITAQNNSSGGSSGSLVAVYYTNTRTGKTTEYMMQGGSTEEHAIETVNLLGDVRNRSYHGTTPQLYNIYGQISYVVPLQNANYAFAGVAIVSVMNPQVIAWGPNASEAELAYKQVVNANSSQMAIHGTRKLSVKTGQVERFGSMVTSGSTTYFIGLNGFAHLFTVPITASATVPVTKIGDSVWIEYYDSGETIMPANRFENKSYVLVLSAIQADVQTRAAGAIEESRTKTDDTRNVQAALEKLPPRDRALLEKQLKK